MPRHIEMPEHPYQLYLMPRSLDELLPVEAEVRQFAEMMKCLDWSVMEKGYASTGRPAYSPEVMTKVLVYAYSKRVFSSRRIGELVRYDLRFKWLAGGLEPDFHTIARFRKARFKELSELIADSARVSAELGLVFLRAVATDGSKFAANVSSRSIYDRRRLDRELALAKELLREAEVVDAAEDGEYGDGDSYEVRDSSADLSELRSRLEEIGKRLRESKRVSASDPDCRMMKTGRGVAMAYNVESVVDAESQVILGCEVTQAQTDHGQLPGLMKKMEREMGMRAGVVLADSGFSDEETLSYLEEAKQDALVAVQENQREKRRVDLFCSRCFVADEDRDVLICPAGRDLVFKGTERLRSGTYRVYVASGCRSCSFRGECAKGNSNRRVRVSVVAQVRQKMLDRLKSPEGSGVYALRKRSVEPVFGNMKQNLGFSRFNLRGLAGATAEIALVCLAHNVLKCAKHAISASILVFCRILRSLQAFGGQRKVQRAFGQSAVVWF